MKISRRVTVFDAKDVQAESSFWAGLLGGEVHPDGDWHSIIVKGEWVMGVQSAPNHRTPDWPVGPQQQQVHLDLHVDDMEEGHRLAVALGGRQLQAIRRPAETPMARRCSLSMRAPRATPSASESTESRRGCASAPHHGHRGTVPGDISWRC